MMFMPKCAPTALFLMAFFSITKRSQEIDAVFLYRSGHLASSNKSTCIKKRWMKISKIVLKVLVIGYFTILPVMDYIGYKKSSVKRGKAKSEISGVYDVDTLLPIKNILYQMIIHRGGNKLLLGIKWLRRCV